MSLPCQSTQGRVGYWRGLGYGYWPARMPVARDADQMHPLRSDEEGTAVFDYLRRLEEREHSTVK